MKTLLILSGGMDSTTLLYDLLKQGDEVTCLSFNYGQRHKKELKKAKLTTKKLGVKHHIVNISKIYKVVMSQNSLTGNIEVPEGHYAEETMKQTVVPYRNGILLMIAAGVAATLKYDRVAYGAHAGDHAIYPDCTPEFVEGMKHVLKIGDYQHLDLYSPYQTMDKGDIAIKGKELNVDYKKTWTCYKGKKLACGKCGACRERLEAFEKAGIKDVIKYENN